MFWLFKVKQKHRTDSDTEEESEQDENDSNDDDDDDSDDEEEDDSDSEIARATKAKVIFDRVMEEKFKAYLKTPEGIAAAEVPLALLQRTILFIFSLVL